MRSWVFLFLGWLVIATPTYADQFTSLSPEAKSHATENLFVPRKTEKSIDLSTFPQIQIDTTRLTENQLQILNALRDHRDVPFELITQAWLEHHTRGYNEKFGTNYSTEFVKNLIRTVGNSGGPTTLDPFEFKNEFENRLNAAVNSEPLKFNLEAGNPLEPLLKNRGQCYSGTVCYSLSTRLAWGSQLYRDKQPLIAFTQGHVQPAFVFEGSRLKKKELVGVETTANGGGRNWLGDLDNLHGSPRGALRIVDAELYPLLEIFSPYLNESDREKLSSWLLAQTAQKYSIDLPRLEARVNDEVNHPTPDRNAAKREADVNLYFGNSNARAGDQTRLRLNGSTRVEQRSASSGRNPIGAPPDTAPGARPGYAIGARPDTAPGVHPESKTREPIFGEDLTVLSLSGNNGLSLETARELVQSLERKVKKDFSKQTRATREEWIVAQYPEYKRLPSRVRDVLMNHLVRASSAN